MASHRTDDDFDRIRLATSRRLDPEVADRVMNREFRTPARRRAASALIRTDRETLTQKQAEVRASVRRAAIMPVAIRIPCPHGHAPVGSYCVDRGARGVCGARVHAAVIRRAQSA